LQSSKQAVGGITESLSWALESHPVTTPPTYGVANEQSKIKTVPVCLHSVFNQSINQSINIVINYSIKLKRKCRAMYLLYFRKLTWPWSWYSFDICYYCIQHNLYFCHFSGSYNIFVPRAKTSCSNSVCFHQSTVFSYPIRHGHNLNFNMQ
jgi:hypothetical protein